MRTIGRGTPITITAHLTSPIVGMERVMLDGPVAWAWAMRAKKEGRPLPRITAEYAPDFPLPFARWDAQGAWGWCVSEGAEEVVSWTMIQVRRKPNTYAMSRFAKDKKHHAGIGPFKARDVTLPGRLVETIKWEALVTDEDELMMLLSSLTNISGRWHNGFGQVSHWDVERNPGARDGWMNRPLPSPTGTREIPIRPPYWHSSRMALCADR